MKTKKYHTPRTELMSNSNVSYFINHPQIQKFIHKWGYNYLQQIYTRQTKPITLHEGEQSNAMDGRERPFIRDKTAEIYTQGKPNPYLKTDSNKSPFLLLGHCEGSKPLREMDNLENMFIGSKI